MSAPSGKGKCIYIDSSLGKIKNEDLRLVICSGSMLNRLSSETIKYIYISRKTDSQMNQSLSVIYFCLHFLIESLYFSKKRL